MKKYTTTILLLALCIILPKGYVGHGESSLGPLLFHFTHANLLHLCLNFYFIFLFRPRWLTVFVSYFIATLVSVFPAVWMALPTCGMSGMCFAMLSRYDAARNIFRWRLLLMNALLGLIPSFNAKIHIACYISAYIYWRIYNYTVHKYAKHDKI